MRKYITYLFILSLLITLANTGVYAQKKKATRIKASYYQSTDGAQSVNASIVVREKRYQPFKDAMLSFYCLNDTGRVLLQQAKSDDLGNASLSINDNELLFIDPENAEISIEVEYEGNKTTKSSKKKIAFKRSTMEMTFFMKDDIKHIEVDLAQAGNPQAPAEGIDVDFYVKGTFSLYHFGKMETDTLGKAIIEFPTTMPGDTAGVLTIVGRVEDDRNFGTVESIGNINWGIVVPPPTIAQRGLGDTDAPLWMVYTLIVLLSAVWFHYLYVIYMIIKIKLAR